MHRRRALALAIGGAVAGLTGPKWLSASVSATDDRSTNTRPTSALGLFAAAMPVGTWAQFSSDNIDPVIAQGPGGSGYIVSFNGTIPWDPINRKIKANMAAHGRPARQVEFDDATNRWSIVSATAPLGSAHGYDHNTVNPHTGEHYLVQVGNAGGFWRHRAAWERTSAINLGEAVAVGSCWWGGKFDGAGTQGCWMVMNGQHGDLYCYDPLAEKIVSSKRGMTPGAPGSYHNLMEYSALKNCAVYGGGNSYGKEPYRKMWRLNADQSFTAMPDAPHPIGIYHGMQFVDEPVTGNFLAMGFGEIWELNPDGAGKWTKQTGARSLPEEILMPEGAYNRKSPQGAHATALASCQTYGVVILLHASYLRTPRANMFLYKHA